MQGAYREGCVPYKASGFLVAVKSKAACQMGTQAES